MPDLSKKFALYDYRLLLALREAEPTEALKKILTIIKLYRDTKGGGLEDLEHHFTMLLQEYAPYLSANEIVNNRFKDSQDV